MGKREKKTRNKKATIDHQDTFMRMNFLYQIATHYSYNQSTQPLSTFYSNIMIHSARKHVLRIDPSIKRTICKKCKTPLTNCTFIETVDWFDVKCDVCEYSKRFLLPSKVLFTTKNEVFVNENGMENENNDHNEEIK